MNARPIIAVDAMGGDFGPSVVVPGAIDAARLHDLHVLLVGDTPKVEAELAKLDLANVHFDIVQADDVVHMNEKPSDILRRKKNASIQVACRLVKDGKADADVLPHEEKILTLGSYGRLSFFQFKGVIEAICRELDCQPGDIIEYRPEEKKEQ